MTKEEMLSLKPGDKVIASSEDCVTIQTRACKWWPIKGRPRLGKIYTVRKVISDEGYQDIAVYGLRGQWVRERFKLTSHNNVTEGEDNDID